MLKKTISSEVCKAPSYCLDMKDPQPLIRAFGRSEDQKHVRLHLECLALLDTTRYICSGLHFVFLCSNLQGRDHTLQSSE